MVVSLASAGEQIKIFGGLSCQHSAIQHRLWERLPDGVTFLLADKNTYSNEGLPDCHCRIRSHWRQCSADLADSRR